MTTPAPESRTAAPPDLPPHAQVMQMASGHIVAKGIFAVAELGIADHLKDAPLTAEQLASVTRTDPSALHRLLRFMTTVGFFTQDESGRFGLAPFGDALRSDAVGHARSTVRMLAGPGMWPAVGELLHAVRSGEPGFNKVHGQGAFDYFGTRPDEARLFNEAMIGFHGAEPPAVAAAYDFSDIGTLMDVGGGTGNLLTTVLQAHPGVRGVLFDLSHVAVEARRAIAVKRLTDRCEVREGSFFDAIPPGADAYMMSHVIHDWDEPKCLTILRNCHRAMQGRGRLLLIEMVLPQSSEFHPGKLLDVVMLIATGGMERTAPEYGELVAKAGFEMTRVVPTASAVSVVEARPV